MFTSGLMLAAFLAMLAIHDRQAGELNFQNSESECGSKIRSRGPIANYELEQSGNIMLMQEDLLPHDG